MEEIKDITGDQWTVSYDLGEDFSLKSQTVATPVEIKKHKIDATPVKKRSRSVGEYAVLFSVKLSKLVILSLCIYVGIIVIGGILISYDAVDSDSPALMIIMILTVLTVHNLFE